MYPELTQFENWLNCQYPHSSTRKHYASDLVLFFSWAKKTHKEISSHDVEKYINHCLTNNLSPVTINRRLSALRSFYYFLSIVNDDPIQCTVISKRHFLHKPRPLPRDASEEEIEILFSSIHNPRDTAIFTLMLECGFRVGEVCHPSLEDAMLEEPPHLRIYGKGDKYRIVYLSPPARRALESWLTSRPTTKGRAVFISNHGKRLSVSGIQFILKEYCDEAGIHLTCHQFRHAFGRRMAETNMPVTSLQKLLGHNDLRTAQVYVRLANPYLQAEYDRAISQVTAPCRRNSCVSVAKRRYHPEAREINSNGYLNGLPEWLADPIHAYCTRHSPTKDPIQHTRNLLSCLAGFARWVLTHSPISSPKDITPRIWFAYAETRLKEKIKPTSLNTTLRRLQSFLKFIRDSDHPICERMLEIRPLKAGEFLPRDVTDTQLNSLLEQANLHDSAWILLMAHSGLRTCEIRELRWRDIDLKNRTLRIEESKGLRSRVVFLSQPAIEMLKQLPKAPEYVFTYNDLPLSSRYCQSRLKTLGKNCGIQVTPHQLRHACATLLLNAGMSVFGVQAILGHRYVDTTLRYARAHDATVARDYQQAISKAKHQHIL
jgi:integrase/recombinase XerC